MSVLAPMKTLSNQQKILAGVLVFTFVTSLAAGAYSISYEKNRIKCLGCLALRPDVPGFDGNWWINYPEGAKDASGKDRSGQPVDHPQEIVDALSSYKAVFLFFYQSDCTGCKEQWEDMKEAGIVKGDEDNGQMDKYSLDVVLFTLNLDRGNPDYSRNMEWFETYDAFNQRMTPTSVFLTHYKGEIGWYSVAGQMSAGEVDGILSMAINH